MTSSGQRAESEGVNADSEMEHVTSGQDSLVTFSPLAWGWTMCKEAMTASA